MKDKRELLKLIVEANNAELVSYKYFNKIFGNFVIEIKYNGKIHTFVTDRGEIYHNSSMICDGAYHKATYDDVFDKLVEGVKAELFV